MEELVIQTLSQIPLAAGILIVVWRLGVRLIDRETRQDEQEAAREQQRDKFMGDLLGQFTEITASLQQLSTMFNEYRLEQNDAWQQNRERMSAVEHNVTELAERTATAISELESTISRVSQQRVKDLQTLEQMNTIQQEEMNALQQEVKSRMAKLQEENHNTAAELQRLNERLDRLNANLEDGPFQELTVLIATVRTTLEEVQAAAKRVQMSDDSPETKS